MRNKFLKGVLKILDDSVNESRKGYSKIGSPYWFGRLCMSREIRKKVKRLIFILSKEKE